eukprot:GEMP01022084.1.p1 GENE.GEMP01022084.1~~GEMP01022084.1.p1  ORF type:complete len:473 (+),score=75.70 GEMP01022084.1:27-1421(+)
MVLYPTITQMCPLSMDNCPGDFSLRRRCSTCDESQSALTLKTETCTTTRGPHGLFDYEARDIVEKCFYISRSFNIVRNETEVHTIVDNNETQYVAEETLARVVCHGEQYFIQRPPLQKPAGGSSPIGKSSKLWRVIKDSHTARLREGDAIKLAAFRLRVRLIVAADDTESAGSSLKSPFPVTLCSPKSATHEGDDLCRICLMEGSDESDPLICPCKCKGSIEFIHLECLRHWINDKLCINKNDDNTCVRTRSFYFRPIKCELCKAMYTTHLLRTNEDGSECRIPIVDLPKTQAPYIVLERDSDRPSEKGVHVLCLANKHSLKLGRGHESDIRFTDGSISRWHATMHYSVEDKKFRLEDHNSKFGTLLAMATRSPVLLDKPIILQAGRTVLHFKPPVSTPRPFPDAGDKHGDVLTNAPVSRSRSVSMTAAIMPSCSVATSSATLLARGGSSTTSSQTHEPHIDSV